MVSTDREALVSLFRSTGGAGWIRRENWDTDAYLATWNGVKVNDQGRVVNLDLKYNNLQGSIPPELGKLAALRELDLHGNQLTGRIPKELGDLTELKEVTLYHNNLTGRIPEEMGNLKALTHLLLNHNSLEGPIPLELGNLAAVQHLSLQDNQLSGEIPASLGQFSELQQLILWKNRLSGTIPEALGYLSALVSLRLSDNSLEGPRPKELGNLTQLKKLILHNNLTGRAFGLTYDDICGFIDGTLRRFCSPGGHDDIQREVYDGHHRDHGLAYQAVMAPNGMLMDAWGPVSGRRHDSYFLRVSEFNPRLAAVQDPEGPQMKVYGDAAYLLLSHVSRGFKGANLTDEQRAFKQANSKMRISIEWGFGKVVQLFPFCDFRMNQKLFLQPVARYYINACVLTDAHTCLRGSQTGAYFDVVPPTLEEYFS